jgi:hypothetical protein
MIAVRFFQLEFVLLCQIKLFGQCLNIFLKFGDFSVSQDEFHCLLIIGIPLDGALRETFEGITWV